MLPSMDPSRRRSPSPPGERRLSNLFAALTALLFAAARFALRKRDVDRESERLGPWRRPRFAARPLAVVPVSVASSGESANSPSSGENGLQADVARTPRRRVPRAIVNIRK